MFLKYDETETIDFKNVFGPIFFLVNYNDISNIDSCKCFVDTVNENVFNSLEFQCVQIHFSLLLTV